MKKFFVVALIAVALALASVATACKDDDDDSGDLGEPDIKTFSVSFDFLNQVDPDFRYNATIKDERTNCGKQNLEQLGIVTIIEEATTEAFTTTATNGIQKGRFRNTFGQVDGVTIYVNNPVTPYKVKAPNGNTIYFHIDYLKSNPSDIQKNIFDAVTEMNPGNSNPNLPYNAE